MQLQGLPVGNQTRVLWVTRPVLTIWVHLNTKLSTIWVHLNSNLSTIRVHLNTKLSTRQYKIECNMSTPQYKIEYNMSTPQYKIEYTSIQNWVQYEYTSVQNWVQYEYTSIQNYLHLQTMQRVWATLILFKAFLTLSLLDRPKPATLLFYPVKRQTILLIKGEPLGGKWLTMILSLYKAWNQILLLGIIKKL